MLRLQGNYSRVKSTIYCNRTKNYSKCMLCSEVGLQNSYDVNVLVLLFMVIFTYQ